MKRGAAGGASRRMSVVSMAAWSARAGAPASHPGCRGFPPSRGRDDALEQRHRGEPGALLVLRQVLEPEALEQRPQVGLDRVDAEETSSAISRFVAGVANAESRTGRQSATRIWRCVGVSGTAAAAASRRAVDRARPSRGRGR